jgi:CDP-paratose synthetase
MKYLVTGATGYLGSHLVLRLLSEGNEVAAFKRHKSNLSRLQECISYIDWYNADETDITAPFKRHSRFDAVIHTATCYGRNGESAATVFEANTAFPVRLLDAAIFFDTETFFNTDTYFNTNNILSPYLKLYTLSKKYFAEWGKVLTDQSKTRFVNLRMEHIYGPLDDSSKFTTHIVRQCLANVPNIALTLGEQLRDFIYIDDAVSAYCLLLEKHQLLPGGYVNVGLGSGTTISLREFVENVYIQCNSTSKLEFGIIPYRDYEIMESVADVTVLNSLGWSPFYNIQSGIQKFILVEKLKLQKCNQQE